MANNRSKTIAVVAGVATLAVGAAWYLSSRRRRARVQLAASPKAAPPPPPCCATPAEKPEAAAAPRLTEEEQLQLQQREEAVRAKERGNKRFQGRQYQLAIDEYTKAIEISPDPKHKDVSVFYGNRAQCYASIDKYEEAEHDCACALDIDPTYVKALCRRAMAREKLGNVEAALLDLTAACMLSGFQNEMATSNTDRLIKEVGRVKAEAKLLQPMTSLPSPFFIATFIDSFKEHRELLATQIRTAAEIDAEIDAEGTMGGRAALLAEKALAHMAQRQYEHALGTLEAAAELLPPAGVPPAAATTEEKAAQAQWEAAAASGAAKVPPALALSLLGMLLHLRGNYDEAMGRYEQALALQPAAIDVLLKRSSLWFEKEQLPQAHADFDAALALDPSHPDIYCHRGQLHMLQNELSAAIADLRRAAELDPGSMLAAIQLGMALHRNQQPTEARAVFERAEARFASSPDVLNYHGELLVETGELDAARRKFEAAISVSGGKFALAHVNQGVLLLHEQQDLEGAIALCRTAVQVDPLCETAHVHMAHLCLQKNDLEAAVASYDLAVGLLRMKQELIDCFSMREAAAAQLALLRQQPEVFGPVMEDNRKRAAAAAAAAGVGAGQGHGTYDAHA